MEIETLKDFKDVLEKIPNEVLDKFSIGLNEDSECNLGCSEGDDEKKMAENYNRYFREYPKLDVIRRYFANLQKEIEHPDETNGEPVNSSEKMDKKI